MNFEYQNPTRLIFAAGALARLGEVASQHGKRALVKPEVTVAVVVTAAVAPLERGARRSKRRVKWARSAPAAQRVGV